MASQVDIINNALIRLGQDTIAAVYPTEASTEARLATQLWTPVLRSVLRAHPWNFAITLSTLTLLGTTPDDYDYGYQLPTDCVRALELVKATSSTSSIDMFYEIRAGGELVTDVPDAVLKYIKLITDTTKFDDEFVEALSYRLAVDLSLPITGDKQIQANMTRLYQMAIAHAKQSSAQETRRKDTAGRSILDSRA